MSLLSWFHRPRQLPLLFFAVTLLPAAGLLWLGWRLFLQDMALMDQRLQERRERAADLLVAALEQRLLATEQDLVESSALPALASGDDALRVVFGPQSINASPKTHMLYYPIVPRSREAPESPFRALEAYEFRLQDYAKAIAGFRELGRARNSEVRAGAQLRLARNLRKAGDYDAALAAYQELARADAVTIDGVPAELLARRARCALLAELNRNDDLRREAQALYADLSGARWQLERAVYSSHAQEIGGWIEVDRESEAARLALTAGADWLWEKWRTTQGETRDSGRQSLVVGNRLVTLLWRVTPGRMVGLIAGPHYVERQWLDGLRPMLEKRSVQVVLRDQEGHAALGGPLPATARQAQRAVSDTGLPWTLLIGAADPQSDIGQLEGRRSLLFTGLALMMILVCAGSYFTSRAFLREIAAARLQTDFVAAVSHEFRTPLASLRQLTENLLDGRVTAEERRRPYYRAQLRATERLHRLVEGLLDFGRMEAGTLFCRLEPANPAELARSVVEDFQQEGTETDHRVELILQGELPTVRVDPEAFTRALWNLLDNAVKYSPGSPVVRLELECRSDQVLFRVRDRGLGIAPEEQKRIFRKFFRGSAARTAGVKGTGIGLTMVQRIVQAHGGDVRIERAPDAGSTFIIALPVIGSKAASGS